MRTIHLPLLLLAAAPLAAQADLSHLIPPQFAEKASRPLPDPTALISRVMAQAKKIGRLVEAYCYREIQTEQKLDRQGNPTEGTVSVYEVTHLPGGKVRRLVEMNGKPLSAEKAREEEARVQAYLRELQEPRPEPKSSQKGGEISLSVEDMLAVSEIGPISRAEHKGHPVLAMAFRPRKGVSPKGMGQRLAAKLEGRLLVDEATDQVVRAEGRLLESFWVGGGLLGAVLPPSTFVFEQQCVAEGLWMPVEGTFSLYARVTFVPLRRRMSFQCSDFHRFVVEMPGIRG